MKVSNIYDKIELPQINISSEVEKLNSTDVVRNRVDDPYGSLEHKRIGSQMKIPTKNNYRSESTLKKMK